LFRQIQLAGLTNNDIQFLGYLPEADLSRFYAGAQVFLFPTLYEGFGLPPVEAMACGTPVIASDAQCMPEVLGEAAILLPPTEAESFAAAILSLLANDHLRQNLQRKGIQRAQAFRFERSVKQLLEIFEGPPRPTVGAVEPRGAVA
jgi:glycosyltransferase involved in cell wall biosynthesis